MAETKPKPRSKQVSAGNKNLIVADDVKVTRESEVVSWMVDGRKSVKDAAKHFGCSTSVIRRILKDAGVKPAVQQETLWDAPASTPQAAVVGVPEQETAALPASA